MFYIKFSEQKKAAHVKEILVILKLDQDLSDGPIHEIGPIENSAASLYYFYLIGHQECSAISGLWIIDFANNNINMTQGFYRLSCKILSPFM